MNRMTILLLPVLISGCATTGLQQTEYCFETQSMARYVGNQIYPKLSQTMGILTEHTAGIGIEHGKVKSSACPKGKGTVMFVYKPPATSTLDDEQKQQITKMGVDTFNDLMKSYLKNNPDKG